MNQWELTIVSSLKHKHTQSIHIFKRKNPQKSEPRNGSRRGLDFIALKWKLTFSCEFSTEKGYISNYFYEEIDEGFDWISSQNQPSFEGFPIVWAFVVWIIKCHCSHNLWEFIKLCQGLHILVHFHFWKCHFFASRCNKIIPSTKFPTEKSCCQEFYGVAMMVHQLLQPRCSL